MKIDYKFCTIKRFIIYTKYENYIITIDICEGKRYYLCMERVPQLKRGQHIVQI